MSALHATTLLNCTADELVAVSVLVSRFNSSPCPFEEDLDEPSLDEDLPWSAKGSLTLALHGINGELVDPGTLLSDAMDQAEDNYPEYKEKETCRYT